MARHCRLADPFVQLTNRLRSRYAATRHLALWICKCCRATMAGGFGLERTPVQRDRRGRRATRGGSAQGCRCGHLRPAKTSSCAVPCPISDSASGGSCLHPRHLVPRRGRPAASLPVGRLRIAFGKGGWKGPPFPCGSYQSGSLGSGPLRPSLIFESPKIGPSGGISPSR